MRTRHARQIRLGIATGIGAVEQLAPYDEFTRGFSYICFRPRNKLALTAYQRTWHAIEKRRDDKEAHARFEFRMQRARNERIERYGE